MANNAIMNIYVGVYIYILYFSLQPPVIFSSLEQKIIYFFNLLKPAGHVMHQQFNIQQLYVLRILYLCVLYLSENRDLCCLQHKMFGFYNWDEKFLLRGTNWIFK